MKPTLATRRARVRRINAKRPRVDVDVDLAFDERPGARDELVDVLLELLAAKVHSRGC